MEAGIRQLRDNLSRYLVLVCDGTEVTVTDHGRAIARIVPIDASSRLQRLIDDGLVTPARATKRRRVEPGLDTGTTVSDLVAEQRR